MKKLFLLFILFLETTAFSQTKQLTIEEAVIGLSTNLRIENKNLSWIPGQDKLTEIAKTSYGKALVSYSLPEMKVDTLLTTKNLQGSTVNDFSNLRLLDANSGYFSNGSTYFWLNLPEKKVSNWAELPENIEITELNPENKQIAYVVDNNLFLVDSNGKKHQITKDGKYGIVNGKTVHREEFGIEKGIFFSPKGNLIAFYRMDETMVEDYPIIDWTTVPAVNQNIKYPFAGRTSHQVTIGVFNTKTDKAIFLQTGEPKEQYLTSVTWSPDEKSVFVGVLNRDQNHLKLNQYDAQTGKLIQNLFEEKDDKYVEPQHELYFLPNGKEFVWWSQRDGFMHLYCYDLSGKLINQITKGNWLVNEIIGQNPKSHELMIAATKDGAKEKHIYKVNWENGKMERLDKDPGTHNATANDAGTYVLDNWSNENTPRKIDVYSTNKNFNKNLLTSSNPLSGYEMPKVENVTLKADDGTDLYGKLIYPTKFNPNEKYPVIVYLYNGPHVQLNVNRFPASGNLWYDYMAQKGYVVFVMDGRGSGNRGIKFEQAVFRKLGETEMNDQMKGINYLKSLPFVEGERMGIHGWSFGGFMTTSFMLRKPDVFKVGVAGGPVLDWSMYEVMYTERYMDTPESNPEGYAANKLLDKSANLKGKLLLIHGTQDPVVVWQHSINFLKNAVSNGVQVDYFVYPGYEHNVIGKDRVHLMQKVSDYFDLYLKEKN